MAIRAPRYRLHRASGQALVEINKRRIYLGKYGSDESKERYRRLLLEWSQASADPVRATNNPVGCLGITINQLILRYFQFAQEYYVGDDGSPTSEVNCIKYALRPLRALFGCTPAAAFGPKALKSVRSHMIALGWARTLINGRINRIRRAFKWGVSEELVPPSVLEGLRSVAGLKAGRTTAKETAPVKPVPDELVDAVLPFVQEPVAAMIQLQRLTGMRPGEVVVMRAVDVDQSGEVWVYSPDRHKTAYRGHRREIFLGPKAIEILRPFVERKKPDEFLFSPKDAEADRNRKRRLARKTPMTPSQAARVAKTSPLRAKRERYDRDSYRRAIAYGIKKANVGHWHPHQLRHSCGTAVRRRFGLDVVQVVLGHRHAETSEIYAEADRLRAAQVMAEIG